MKTSLVIAEVDKMNKPAGGQCDVHIVGEQNDKSETPAGGWNDEDVAWVQSEVNKSAGGQCATDADEEQSADMGRPAGDQSDAYKPDGSRYAGHVDGEQSDTSETSAGCWHNTDVDGYRAG